MNAWRIRRLVSSLSLLMLGVVVLGVSFRLLCWKVGQEKDELARDWPKAKASMTAEWQKLQQWPLRRSVPMIVGFAIGVWLSARHLHKAVLECDIEPSEIKARAKLNLLFCAASFVLLGLFTKSLEWKYLESIGILGLCILTPVFLGAVGLLFLVPYELVQYKLRGYLRSLSKSR